VISGALLIALALGPASAGAAGEPKGATGTEQAPHLACEAALRSIAGMRGALTETAEHGTLAEFRKLHLDLAERLRLARTDMEHAVFIGAWKDRAVKQDAFDLTWRIDAVQTLSFIVLAFTSDYYPSATGKPTPSVKDATRKMFVQLDHLIERIAAVNRKVAAAAPAGAPARRVGALR
jgi:hypothetical protein